MKNKIRLLVIFILFALTVEAKPKNSTKSVTVEIELEEIPNVQIYEIEVKKTSDKKEIIQNFTQPESVFKIKLNVGNYLVRTRIVSTQAEIGPWSEWSELLARPEDVELIDAPSYNISARKNQDFSVVDLKWQRANGADKYIIWVEDQASKTTVANNSGTNSIKINLKTGEYKIGVQSVSKDGIRSKIKYFDNSFFVAKTQLPRIDIKRADRNSFQWTKQNESDVKIEIYRKPFFGEKYIKIQTLKERGESWYLPQSLLPGEYRIDFQYISEAFENGPVQSVSLLKKPGEKDFSNAAN